MSDDRDSLDTHSRVERGLRAARAAAERHGLSADLAKIVEVAPALIRAGHERVEEAALAKLAGRQGGVGAAIARLSPASEAALQSFAERRRVLVNEIALARKERARRQAESDQVEAAFAALAEVAARVLLGALLSAL